MGTDIHIFFEYYDAIQKKWVAIKITNEWREDDPGDVIFLTDEELDSYKDTDRDLEREGIQFDTGRHYGLFGLLGCTRYRTAESTDQSLAKPRGMPKDSVFFLNEKFYKENLEWCHTHTYFTLTELLNANTKERRQECMYEEMMKLVRPLEYHCREEKIDMDSVRAIICFDS